MTAVASGYFLICLVELAVGFVFGSASVQTAGRTPFSAENNVPGVSSVV